MSTYTPKLAFWIARVLLLLFAIILCFAGITGLFDTTKLSGDAILAPDGVTSVRVDYGGFHLGLGLFAVLGVLNPSFLKAALVAGSITMTLVVLVRCVGMMVDGVTDAQIAIISIEAIPFALAIIGLAVIALRGEPDSR